MTHRQPPIPRKRLREWFGDESFWQVTYPFMFPEKRFEIAPDTIKRIRALTKPRGKRVLDLCCGPGRHSVALALKGFSVTGVDRSQYLLDKARARARDAQVRVEWIQDDMRSFLRPDTYDLALSMFTSFGFFDNRDEDAGVLANILASLRPNGVFVIDLMGKETLARIFQPTSVDILPDGSMLVEQRRIVDDWTRIVNEWTIIRNSRTRKFTLRLNLYSGRELRELLERAGFVNVRLFANLDGEPYGAAASRLIAVASKGDLGGSVLV